MQYAHARLASLARNAADLGIERAATILDPACSTPTREIELIGAARRLPARSWPSAAELREPHRVARYLEDLAGGLPPVLRLDPGAADGRRDPTDPDGSPAVAVRGDPQVLANGLGLLGVSAPERM